jgi:hypothetical protein
MGRRRPIYVKALKAFKTVLSSTYSSLKPFILPWVSNPASVGR